LVAQPDVSSQTLESFETQLESLVLQEVAQGATAVYIAKGTARRELISIIGDENGQDNHPLLLEQNDPVKFQLAKQTKMIKNEGLGFTVYAFRGPTILDSSGNELPADFFYRSRNVSRALFYWGNEQQALTVEKFLQQLTMKWIESNPLLATLIPLWEVTGSGKRRGDAAGWFCVDITFFNIPAMIENEGCKLNDTRSHRYKNQLSKPFGGYTNAKAKGLFVKQANPSYENNLRYQRERERNQMKSSTKEQLADVKPPAMPMLLSSKEQLADVKPPAMPMLLSSKEQLADVKPPAMPMLLSSNVKPPVALKPKVPKSATESNTATTTKSKQKTMNDFFANMPVKKTRH
jgi:hypothetical protein